MSEPTENLIPPAETKGGVVAYLAVDGALKAAALYEAAFGATIATIYPPDEQGRTMHVHLHINGSSVMLGDFYPDQGHAFEKPQAFNLTIMVDDIDTWYARAVAAGVTGVMPPQKMFWGDTYAQLTDPFGVTWSMNQQA